MPAWIGTATGNKAVSRAVVGTATGNKEVTQIWVGTTGGNKLVWQSVGLLNLAATAQGPHLIRTTWNNPGSGVDSYKIYRNGALVITGTGLVFDHGGLTPSTTYTFRVDAYKGAQLMTSDTAQGTTTALTTQQKSVTLSPAVANSYNGSGAATDAYRTNVRLYHGRYDATWNINRSKVWFSVPADVRNCVSVDSVRVSLQNQHTFESAMTYGLGLHFDGGAGSQFGGTSGVFRTYSVGRGAATGWLDITDASIAGRTVKEHFRVGGAWGYTLEPTSTALSQYGYFAPTPQLQITYTVQV